MANQGKKTTQETSQAQLPLPQSNGDGTAPGWLDMLSTFGGGSGERLHPRLVHETLSLTMSC